MKNLIRLPFILAYYWGTQLHSWWTASDRFEAETKARLARERALPFNRETDMPAPNNDILLSIMPEDEWREIERRALAEAAK